MTSNKWAPAAFFDEQHEDHASYALATLVHWIKHSTKFRHIPSGTWRGGPVGVRWVLAVITYIVGSLTFLDHGIDVPGDIQKLRNDDFQKRAWGQVTTLTEWLGRALQLSIDTLTQTFPQRSTAWQEAVLSEYQRNTTSSIRFHSARSTPSVDNTNGLPLDPAEIHAYAQSFIQNGAKLPIITEPKSPSPTIHAHGRARPKGVRRTRGKKDVLSMPQERVLT